jgi:N-acetylglutamate synthase-like GNAT family acetyltransferase
MIKNDMLVELYRLDSVDSIIDSMKRVGVTIRRAQPWEISQVREFVIKEFTVGWADEFIAMRNDSIIGFAAYECTRRSYFGPTGVAASERQKGIGKALLLVALNGLREMGYAYAIIGSAESPEFYKNAVGAIEIENSAPGIYADPIGKIGFN